MITKGVASVRSPVCNLQQFSSTISHDAFSNAVIRAFQEEYNIDQEVSLF
jgi:lipoate-protein ligase A